MSYPIIRPRRLRQSANIRKLVSETQLSVNDLVAPFFIVPGERIRKPIDVMPGQFQFSVDSLCEELKEVQDLGITSVLLFGIPEWKDSSGSSSWHKDGIIQKAARALKDSGVSMTIIADLCFCEYTDHGHCGVLRENARGYDLDNDATRDNLALQAVSLAQSGVDIVAPSGNIDGMVSGIRTGLDAEGLTDTIIMSYAVKYSSAFYGPFRVAVDSAPSFGDRKCYQMDPPNVREAVREALLDQEEGADMLIVKPALSYLDVISEVKRATQLPLAAYNVSGEYSMIKCAAKAGLLEESRAMNETLLSMKRAGADILITYFAKDVARELKR